VPLRYFNSFEARDEFILLTIQKWLLAKVQPLDLPLGVRTFAQYTSIKRPLFHPPRVPYELFEKHASFKQLHDAGWLAKLGATAEIDRVNHAIIDDGLGGAYKAIELSYAIAEYAHQLDDYLATVKIARFVDPPNFPAAFFLSLADYSERSWRGVFPELFILPSHTKGLSEHNQLYTGRSGALSHPTRIPTHRNGALQALTRVYNLNSLVTLKAAVSYLEPSTYPGQLGRLHTLICTTKAVTPSPVVQRIADFIDLVTLGATNKDADDPVWSTAYDYLMGNLSLLPAPTSPLSPLVLTVNRDITLDYIESYQPQVFRLPKLELAFYVSIVEHYVLSTYIQMVKQTTTRTTRFITQSG
jgi:hypothetical protein